MARRQSKRVQDCTPATDARYSSKIIKAGALLADTKTLLSHWDRRARSRRTWIASGGKTSSARRPGPGSRTSWRSSASGISPRMRSSRPSSALVRDRLPAVALDRILYFHAAQSDRLLHDVVIEWLVPLQGQGIIDIDVVDVQRLLGTGSARARPRANGQRRRPAGSPRGSSRPSGTSASSKGPSTSGSPRPTSRSTAFAYVMFYLKQHQPSGAKLVELPDWRLFFLPREGVERFLFEAHQRGLLEYHAAGSVTRLSFPAATLEEYAHVLAERAH